MRMDGERFDTQRSNMASSGALVTNPLRAAP
jgi:hypothetical protein